MKNKRIDHMSHIMSKRHGIFAKNCTIFFSYAGKIENSVESPIRQILDDNPLEKI